MKLNTRENAEKYFRADKLGTATANIRYKTPAIAIHIDRVIPGTPAMACARDMHENQK